MRAFIVTFALGLVPSAFAQTAPVPARPSVLPTGGGQALLDPSDTVFLLLDHQAGLFQTVKDSNCAVAGQRYDAGEARDPSANSRDHDGFRADRPEWTYHAGNSAIRPASNVCTAQRRSECVGQRRLRQHSPATGRKTLVMAGVWTSVCVMFPALFITPQPAHHCR